MNELLEELIEVIAAQTNAITLLAQSNQALAEQMRQASEIEPSDDDGMPRALNDHA